MNWVRFLIFFCAALLPAFGAEEHSGESQRNMTPWLWANFIILMSALVYLSRKYGAPLLKQRQDAITKGIADAEAKKADARARVEDVDRRLASLDTEIANLKTQMREEQAQEAQRLAARNAAELARVQQQAEQEITAAGKAARLDLQAHAATLALDLAEQKLRSEMTDDAQHRLTRGFVESIR